MRLSVIKRLPAVTVLFLGLAPQVSGQQRFNHYKGFAYEGKAAEWDMASGHQMQKTSEYTYEKFVRPGELIDLKLPIENGNDIEPRGYFRWYDYYSDSKSERLVTTTYGKELEDFPDAANSAGLMAWDRSGTTTWEAVAAVHFQAPGTGWVAGDSAVIACDVSRYVDGVDGGNLLHEPTLSMRYKYKVYPATTIADRLKNAIISTEERVYENYGFISFGIKDGNSITNLRLNLQNVSDYYFYNYLKSDDKVLDKGGSEADFEPGTLYQAQRIVWRVFDVSGDFYKDLNGAGKMYAVSLNNLNSQGTWKYIGGESQQPATPSAFKVGDIVHLAAFVSDGSGHKCPLASFTCRFYGDSYPMLIEDGMPEYRTMDYLDQNYNHVAEISFDNEGEDATLAAPTSPGDNMIHLPSDWNKHYYGFVYYGLYDKMKEGWAMGLSPFHGEYGLYKSLNVKGVSQSGVNSQGYFHRWWYTRAPFYDCTYAQTKGSQYGYFLYVDAAEEPRQIAATEFEGSLCAGSIIVISVAVANLTLNASFTPPQLMFKLYGVEEDADGQVIRRKLIHTFASGNLKASGADSFGKWYQVYIRSSLQTESGVEDFNKFYVTIDNYCPETYGADYAIDDIRIFTRNSKLDVVQQVVPCNDGREGDLKIRMNYESLIAWMGAYSGWNGSVGRPGRKYLYWRIYNSDGTPYAAPDGFYNSTDGWEGKDYGRVTVYRAFSNNNSATPGGDGVCGNETNAQGEEYVVIRSGVKLPLNGGYYVSLARQNDDDGACSGEWGTPADICSAYSEVFRMQTQKIEITDMEGNVLSNFPLPCGAETGNVYLGANLTIPDPVRGGTYTLTAKDIEGKLKFNWTVTRYDNDKNVVATYENVDIPFAYEAAKHLSSDGYLYITLTPELTLADGESFTIYTGKTEETEVILCLEPENFALKATSSGPQLVLGFSGVTYDSSARTVRLGLGQLDDMVTSQGSLILPVHSFVNNSGTTDRLRLELDADEMLTIHQTDDPTCTIGEGVAYVSGLVYNESARQVEIRFTAEGTMGFHEGYWYEVNFQVYEEDAYNPGSKCYGDVFFTIKVVPEYVTWTGAANNGLSTNWNNDTNWTRSEKAYIYKGDDYADYGAAGGIYANLAPQQAFVPMKFTKVTIDPSRQSIRLAALGTGQDGIVNSGLLNSEYEATDKIQYDLMVKVAPGSDGHYECEKFYGNACKEIYFKPAAEIRYQQYLTYDRAWVEYELQPDKWYMLTSPLKEVYAGDMYVPAGAGATQGRQETEAFRDIRFGIGYSRTAYPLYQRSWDSAETSKVIVAPADGRGGAAGSYGAGIIYSDWTDADVAKTNWSHTYNDVSVPYTPMAANARNGFSLRANKKDVTNDGTAVNALIRLPKADTQYAYYDYGNAAGTSVTGSVVKTGGRNLLVDDPRHADVTMSLSNENSGNGLYLVSNPYMASIDMKRFFETNAGLAPSFWIVSAGTMYAVDVAGGSAPVPTIAPTQAFFVKKAGGSDVSEVRFTTNMITGIRVDLQGNITSRAARFTEAAAPKAAARAMTLTAACGGKRSTAKIVVKETADNGFAECEDVETLYDSNLADVPALYTVAGDRAVSVNALSEITMLPLGVVCSENVVAGVTMSGVERVGAGARIYLLDAKAGTLTALSDTATVELVANEHGRYFLTTRAPGSGMAAAGAPVACYSPSHGLLVVACTSPGVTLDRIELYGINGRLLKRVSAGAPSVTLPTSGTINLVKVRVAGSDTDATFKVSVR